MALERGRSFLLGLRFHSPGGVFFQFCYGQEYVVFWIRFSKRAMNEGFSEKRIFFMNCSGTPILRTLGCSKIEVQTHPAGETQQIIVLNLKMRFLEDYSESSKFLENPQEDTLVFHESHFLGRSDQSCSSYEESCNTVFQNQISPAGRVCSSNLLQPRVL